MAALLIKLDSEHDINEFKRLVEHAELKRFNYRRVYEVGTYAGIWTNIREYVQQRDLCRRVKIVSLKTIMRQYGLEYNVPTKTPRIALIVLRSEAECNQARSFIHSNNIDPINNYKTTLKVGSVLCLWAQGEYTVDRTTAPTYAHVDLTINQVPEWYSKVGQCRT